ncbi:MAG TPA: hypothetical protein VHK01_10560, partial [Lacipirellulaceae bacterium]|nr:hypothetical protein [Lacipirellulaceae bacterium]
MNTAELLQAIRQRAMKLTDAEVAKGLRLFPPASTESVQLAESKLGFSLPSFLKDVYTQVGNGGFGPGYGIIGTPGGFTDDGNDIAGVHQLMSQEDES